jgi:hypothetical protein
VTTTGRLRGPTHLGNLWGTLSVTLLHELVHLYTYIGDFKGIVADETNYRSMIGPKGLKFYATEGLYGYEQAYMLALWEHRYVRG